MIGFAAPLALLGLALVAIPLGLHFFVRTHPPSKVLPTARFLESLPRARRSLSRPKDVLVLTARVLGLMALIVAAAQPFAWRKSAAASGPAPLVLILDDTLSMAHGRPSRFERAKHSLLETLDAAPANARVALLTTSHPRAALEDRAPVRARLVASEASASTGSLLAALETATNLVRESRRARVIVASDFDPVAVADLGKRSLAAPALEPEIVDVGQDTPHNAWLANVALEPETPVAGFPLEVRARVESLGLDSRAEIPVVLTLANGTRQEARAHSGESVRFTIAHPEAGPLRGELQLTAPGDALPLDDRTSFETLVRARLDVVFLAGAGDADAPIPRALDAIAHAPGAAITVTSAHAAELPRALETARVLVLGASSPRDAATIGAIARFLEQGGGLVAFNDEGAHDVASSGTLAARWPGVVRARAASTPSSLRPDAAPMGDALARGLSALLLTPQSEIVPDARATVVLRDSSGAALWVEREHVALLGFAPSGRNEALASETVFPLVVRRALWGALGGATALESARALEAESALERAGPATLLAAARSSDRPGDATLAVTDDADRDDRTLGFALFGILLIAAAAVASSCLAPGAAREWPSAERRPIRLAVHAPEAA